MLNRELEQANNVLRTKRNEVQRIEEEVALLMQVRCCRDWLHFLYFVVKTNPPNIVETLNRMARRWKYIVEHDAK